jgi:uncharacterized protein with beta-barrel porin domain
VLFDLGMLRRQAIGPVAAVVLSLIAMSSAANAACTPAADNTPLPVSGTTVTCSGTTTDQNVTNGYGTGAQTGITINVTNGASVTGSTTDGIAVHDATVNNGTGATISGLQEGIDAIAAINVTNSGIIHGTGSYGVLAGTDATVTNNATGSIFGGQYGIIANNGSANVTNSGSIIGTSIFGIFANNGAANVTNNAGASISGSDAGIATTADANVVNSGTISSANIGITASIANITNSGSILGTINEGIFAGTSATVTNNAGASIKGATGIMVQAGGASVINSGSITGTSLDGLFAQAASTVTNNTGASITGGQNGIRVQNGAANVVNSGSINGTTDTGILAQAAVTVTNNGGASITGGQFGIASAGGAANVTNSGSITGTAGSGIFAQTDATVTNNAGATIAAGQFGIRGNGGFANVTNSGSITGTDSNFGTGIIAFTNATVTNNAGASITGGQFGIEASNGFANVTNSGSITGTSTTGIFAQTHATVTNNAGAAITGGLIGIEANAGGSSVFNAGTISGGAAAIEFLGSGNTLTLAPGSVISGKVLGAGSDTFQLGGSGAATFDVSQLGATAQYQGFGTFNKIDSSIWTLTGTSSFAGPINVNGGTLAVNGDISAASSLTVNAGGTLGGTGTVGTTQINGGTLAPGNSIGTLTVSGSLTMTAASTYLVQVSGASSDKTVVTVAANIAGKVVVDALARIAATTTYTIMSAGTVTGTFSTVDFLAANSFARNARLSYVGNSVLLTLDPGLLSPNLPGSGNVNQKNVAAGIDNALANGATLPAAFNALFALSPGAPLLNALTQVSGETATGSQQTTFDAMNQFMGVMIDPFVAGRGDGPSAGGGSTTGYAEEANAYAAKRNPNDALAAIYTKAPPLVIPFERRWSTWVAGYGGSQNTEGNAALGSNNTTSSVYGTAVGADYRFSPFTIAGFALAGGGTSFSVNGSGSGHSDLFQVGGFVRHDVGPAYISAALAYGWQDITTNRTVTVAGADQLHAEFNANAFSGRLEGGYRFVTPFAGGVGITPYAAGQFTTFDLPSYAESALSGSSAFALGYGSQSVTDARSELGIRTDKSFAVQGGIFTLRGRFAWAHDYDPDRAIAATFQALPGASFVVNGAAQASDSALATASAEMKWINNWSVAATFEGEFSNVTSSYAGKGVVRYAW